MTLAAIGHSGDYENFRLVSFICSMHFSFYSYGNIIQEKRVNSTDWKPFSYI